MRRISALDNRAILFDEARDVEVAWSGPASLRFAVSAGWLRPVSATTGDFDGDGFEDLVTGFAGVAGAAVGILLSDEAVLSPDGPMSETLAPPFRSGALYPTTARPDLIAAGDFDADGRLDLVVAEQGASTLHHLQATDAGTFRIGRSQRLDGRLRALASGDINRRDGLEDLAIGIETPTGGRLELYESPSGALSAVPEVIELKAPPGDIAIAQLDDHWAFDVAVAAGDGIVFVQGRDRDLISSRTAPGAPLIRTVDLPGRVTALATGDFIGSRRRDLAALVDGHGVALLDAGSGERLLVPLPPGSTPSVLESAQSSAYLRDDVVLLDPEARRLHILHQRHFEQAAYLRDHPAAEAAELSGPETVTYNVPRGTRMATSMRLNHDALSDIVLGYSEETGPVGGGLLVATTRPAAAFVVNDSGNAPDADWGDGVCKTESGACTLKAAVAEANFIHGEPTYDEITFSVDHVDDLNTVTWTEPLTMNGASAGMVEVTGGLSAMARSMVRGMSTPSLRTGSLAAVTVEKCHVELDASGLVFKDGYGLWMSGPYSQVFDNLFIFGRIEGAETDVYDNLVGTTGSVSLGYSGQVGTGGLMLMDKAVNGRVRFNTIAGLDVPGPALDVRAKGTLIQGNGLGVDLTGNAALPNQRNNIEVRGEGPMTIGGTTAAYANVLSGTGWSGIGGEVDSLYVLGNFIGTNADGSEAVGNGRWGITLTRSKHVVIGGATTSARNVIAANGNSGISLNGEGPFIIENNLIGTAANGVDSLGTGLGGSSGSGIYMPGGADSRIVDNVVAYGPSNGLWIGSPGGFEGPVEIRRNHIHHHGGAGLVVRGKRIHISENRIHDNAKLGIALGVTEFPSQNDPGDVDESRQNWPVLNPAAGGTINGTLDSTPSTSFTIEFFANEICDPTGNGEGEVFLSSEEVTTDASGVASFTAAVATSGRRPYITATATDPEGNSSEFSNCVEVDPTVTELMVQVLTDTLDGKVARPYANAPVELGTVEEGNRLRWFGSETTDEEGLLALATTAWSPGEPIVVRDSTKLSFENVAYGYSYAINKDGTIHIPRLEASQSDTTRLYITTLAVGVALNLEIDWGASDAYAESLVASMRTASNLLFDVTDGNVYLQQVRLLPPTDLAWVYGTVVRIRADNTIWPSSGVGDDRPVVMPAALYGPEVTYQTNDPGILNRPNRKHNHAASIVASGPLYPEHRGTTWYARALVHELGHKLFLLFDEYQSRNGTRLNDQVNFSIMDDAFDLSSPMSTEWSRDVTEAFRHTEQYAEHEKSAWGWIDRHWLWSIMRDPEERKLAPGTFMKGPNDRLTQPDLDVGSMMTVIDDRQGPKTETLSLLVRETVDGVTRPARDAHVNLVKASGRYIDQGATAPAHMSETSFVTTGNIRILGAEAGDEILAFRPGKSPFFRRTVLGASKWNAEPVVIELEPVAGVPPLLVALELDGYGTLRIRVTAAEPLAEAPVVTFMEPGTERVSAGLREEGAAYVVEVPPGAVDLMLDLPGAGQEGFGLPLASEILYPSARQRWFETPAVGANLRIRSEIDEPFVLLSSPFEPPPNGLPEKVRRVSPVLSLGSPPASFEADLTLFYSDSLFANSPDAVAVYRWNDGWERLESTIDFRLETVTARIAGPGLYMAGLDGTKAAAVTTRDERPRSPGGHGVYPNPIRTAATIAFELQAAAHVQICLFDVLGRVVAVPADRVFGAGRNEVRFDAAGLTPGVYLYTIEAGETIRTGSVVVTR